MAGTTRPKVRWEEFFADEFVAARDRCAVCWAAYGLAEPHGPYNAIGVDFLKALGIVERAAAVHGGIVAPPFAWHILELPEFHVGPRGWFGKVGIEEPLASSIPPDLFYRMVLFHVRAMDARGFHAGILVTGHAGNIQETMRLLCEYYVRRTGSPIRLHACSDGELMNLEGIRYDHAGAVETAQMMALRPELVDLGRTTAPACLGKTFARVEFPDAAGVVPTREAGERFVAEQVETLGRIKDRLLSEYRPRDGWKAPSLTDTDDIWHRFERLTRRYWFITYKERGNGVRTPFPGWEALGE